LKQLSQALIYLEENGLLDRAVLEEKTSSATAQYHALSSKLKSAEKRMTEIKIMQQHIINYVLPARRVFALCSQISLHISLHHSQIYPPIPGRD